MIGLVPRFCIVFVLGLGIVACATTTPVTPTPTSQPTIDLDIRTAYARLLSATKTPPSPRTVVPTEMPPTPYSVMVRGYEVVCREISYEYVSTADLGKVTALQHVANTIYLRLNNPSLYVSAHDAENALVECGCVSTRNCKPLGIGATPIPAPQARNRSTPALTPGAFVWAKDRTPTPSLTEPMPTPTPTPVDYDEDNDGLIEIRTLAQLNAMRWDQDGDGHPAHDVNDEYGGAFPNALADLGCTADGCSGYELVADLDFDTDGSGKADEGDAYWNDGMGWIPMRSRWSVGEGDITGGFSHTGQLSSTLEGNGHTIKNLWGRALILENFGTIRNLVLTGNVDGQYGSWHCGILACSNDSDGVISDVTVLGSVNGPGGLVGENGGTIQDTTSHVTVNGGGGTGGAGGLVGYNRGTISDSTANGTVSGTNYDPNRGTIDVGVGGLVGTNTGTINDSEASVTVSWPYRDGNVGGLVATNRGRISNSLAGGDVSAPSECEGFDRYRCNIVGGLVGLNDGYAITNSSAAGDVSGHSNVGGLVGMQRLGEITGSAATGAVTGTAWSIGGLVGDNGGAINDSTSGGAVSGENAVGGLVGINSGKIERSDASGTVSGVEYVGGLAGRNDSYEGISRSHATGDVEGHSYVGGLVGATYGTIKHSEADGNVKGVEFVGGLAGGVGGDTESVGFQIGGALLDTEANGYVSGVDYVGGLVGWNSGNIKDSTAKGYVSGKYQVDALVGANEGGQISNSTGTGKVSEPR